jgi:hypothetical protein
MKKLYIILLLSFIGVNIYADSPITSTDFYNAYMDIPVIKNCKSGKLDKITLAYLADNSNPLDVKLALINKIGWDRKSNYSKKYLNYIIKKNDFKNNSGFKYIAYLQSAKAEELICYAYLRSMDNYFFLDNAPAIAITALKKNPESKAIYLITSIIKAQVILGLDDVCYMYKPFKEFKENSMLKDDIKPEAVNIIYEYMDLYGINCK